MGLSQLFPKRETVAAQAETRHAKSGDVALAYQVVAVRELGIEVRAGRDTGECELIGEKSAASQCTWARASPRKRAMLVSSTVKDLVAGSTIEFVDQGVKPLKDIPGEWRLFAVQRDGAVTASS